MLEIDKKSETISTGDEAQIHYIENAPHLKYMPLNKDNFEIANAYNLKLIKKKRIRTAFTTEQVLILENIFSERKYVDKWTRKKLANQLKISEKNVKVWFQNRRMKNKRLSSESSDASEANETACNNNESNDNNNRTLPYYSNSESLNNHSIESNNELDIKSGGIQDYQPQFPHDAINEDLYCTQYYHQQQYGNVPFVPNDTFNNNYTYYSEYYNNNYYCDSGMHYDHSVYNYSWPQHYTNL